MSREVALAMQAHVLESLWAIRPSALESLWAATSREVDPSALAAARSGPPQQSHGTAVIPIVGPISRRPDFLSQLFGMEATTTAGISAALQAALSDPGVGRIVLAIDSPGGEVAGTPELADQIYRARAKKPITAFVYSAGSAAYWLASQASDVIVTPSGEVGSIGILAMHLDHSKELEAAGVKPTLIYAGKYKTEGNPLEPLAEEARAARQARVDEAYGWFVRDVARGRGVPVETVRSGFGQARMVSASEAVASHMADGIKEHLPMTTTRAENDHALIFAAARAAVALSQAHN